MGWTLAVLNRKGGTAKTTTAIATAELWARTVGPATVVDLDPQGGSAAWAEIAADEGDAMALSVIQPPTAVTAVQLPGWIRREHGDSERLVFDCPPGESGAQDASIEATAERGGLVLIPTTPKPADVTATATAIEAVGDRCPVAVLLTMTRLGTIRLREAREELEEFGAEVLAPTVPHLEEISRTGLSAIQADGALLNAYVEVASEIGDRLNGS